MDFQTVAPPETLWRVGRQTNPIWFNRPVGPQNFTNDTVGGRFDLIVLPYGTLYVSSTPEDAYAETLIDIVPDEDAQGLLPSDDSIGVGCVDASWRAVRRLCEIRLTPTTEMPALRFVDVSDADNLANLNKQLRPGLAALGVQRLNVSTITSSRRSVTHLVAEYVAACTDAEGKRLYAGIRYPSKHGTNHECWAVFGGIGYTVVSASVPSATDEALRKIAKRYGLTMH